MPQRYILTCLVLVSVTVLFIISCDVVQSEEITESIYTVEEGRIVFENRSELINEIDRLKETERSVLERELEEVYLKGFRSIRPIINAENKVLMQLYERVAPSYKVISKHKTDAEEDFDDFEELIGDDEFASLINTGGEIQVADSVYKYTDAGLYVVHKDHTDHLYEYLEDSDFQLKLPKYDYASFQECSSPAEYELVEVDEHIDHFTRTDECGSVSSGGTGTANNTGNSSSAEQFINGLEECNPKMSFWSRLFGDSWHCVDKFDDSKYRVKTKFWNQNYLLVKSIGVSTKHQRKRFWVWWTNRTDEIRLGLHSASFTVADLTPVVNSIGPEIFLYDGKIYNGLGNYIDANYDKKNLDIPFDAAMVFVVDLTNSVTFNALNIDPNATIIEKIDEYVNEAVIKYAKKIINDQNKLNKGLVIVAYTPNEYVVHLSSHYETKLNARNIRYLFDWQGGLAVNLKFKSAGASLNLKIPTLTKYSNAQVDMYGIARRGEEWAGNRFIYTE